MAKKKNVVFVCTGNLCRSPMAEAMFRYIVADHDDYEVRSAGVCAMGGERPSGETLDVLEEKGIDTSHLISKPFDKKMAKTATHIFVMSEMHAQTVRKMFPKTADRIFLVTEFCEIDGEVGAEVSDPIGLGRPAYDVTYHHFKIALPSLYQYIEQTFK